MGQKQGMESWVYEPMSLCVHRYGSQKSDQQMILKEGLGQNSSLL